MSSQNRIAVHEAISQLPLPPELGRVAEDLLSEFGKESLISLYEAIARKASKQIYFNDLIDISEVLFEVGLNPIDFIVTCCLSVNVGRTDAIKYFDYDLRMGVDRYRECSALFNTIIDRSDSIPSICSEYFTAKFKNMRDVMLYLNIMRSHCPAVAWHFMGRPSLLDLVFRCFDKYDNCFFHALIYKYDDFRGGGRKEYEVSHYAKQIDQLENKFIVEMLSAASLLDSKYNINDAYHYSFEYSELCEVLVKQATPLHEISNILRDRIMHGRTDNKFTCMLAGYLIFKKPQEAAEILQFTGSSDIRKFLAMAFGILERSISSIEMAELVRKLDSLSIAEGINGIANTDIVHAFAADIAKARALIQLDLISPGVENQKDFCSNCDNEDLEDAIQMANLLGKRQYLLDAVESMILESKLPGANSRLTNQAIKKLMSVDVIDIFQEPSINQEDLVSTLLAAGIPGNCIPINKLNRRVRVKALEADLSL